VAAFRTVTLVRPAEFPPRRVTITLQTYIDVLLESYSLQSICILQRQKQNRYSPDKYQKIELNSGFRCTGVGRSVGIDCSKELKNELKDGDAITSFSFVS